MLTKRVAKWVDDRLGTAQFARTVLNKVFPDHWSFMIGELALYCFVILLLTGVYLTFFFDPSANETVSWARGPTPLLNLGPEAPLWATLAMADLGIKIALALVTLFPYRLFTRRLQERVS